MIRITIGRAENNDIKLTDPTVSRNHAELIIQNGQITVRDLNSANGTFINGNRIHGTASLNSLDILKTGNALVAWKNYLGNQTFERSPQHTVFNNQNQPTFSSKNEVLPNASAILVLGIVSIVLFWIPIIGLACGIVGIGLSSKPRRLYHLNPNAYINKGVFNGGFICSLIGTILSGMLFIYYLAVGVTFYSRF
jgi:hypothetical protein